MYPLQTVKQEYIIAHLINKQRSMAFFKHNLYFVSSLKIYDLKTTRTYKMHARCHRIHEENITGLSCVYKYHLDAKPAQEYGQGSYVK
jgi:hypothetical protein